ncbi:MAG TPA: hypothetical protein VK590_03095 [Saprospiraceae bacterium]|nr:hypothetical protein [Saprospiraceae bacterium]
MKSKYKTLVLLTMVCVISISSCVFLRMESTQNKLCVDTPVLSEEMVKAKVPTVNEGKMVKLMIEALIKLVPKG